MTISKHFIGYFERFTAIKNSLYFIVKRYIIYKVGVYFIFVTSETQFKQVNAKKNSVLIKYFPDTDNYCK